MATKKKKAPSKRPPAKKKGPAKPKRPAPKAKKTPPKKTPPKKTPPKKASPRLPAAHAYQSQVRAIIDARARRSSYAPDPEPKLSLSNYRKPMSVAELSASERAQLEAIWAPKKAEDVVADEENQLEVADVVDGAGNVRYQLFAWNYGVGYLLANGTNDVVAMGCQHDIELWNEAQRPIFYAMDRALANAKPTFAQPLSFSWWDDDDWTDLDARRQN